MGGRAFLQHFPAESLPRLPTSLYEILKTRFKTLLLTLFEVVEVPPEKPQKKDHGDIDFAVARPLGHEQITPEQVGRVLGAVKSIELDGNRTSNYAISVCQEDWLEHSAQPAPSDHIYCQVDVKVCCDEEEVERVTVFHGYGDLGIMIGAIAKGHELSVNPHGLKVIKLLHPHYITLKSSRSNAQVASPQPNPPTFLTGSPRLIFDFLGLSMDRWIKGFEMVEETFEFAATSRFFDPRRLHVPSMQTLNKSAQERSMYIDFLSWAQDKDPTVTASEQHQDAVGEALVTFGKKSEWDAMVQEKHTRTWLKCNFNGKLVAEWTGLGWRGVKVVMDDVRSSVGGERSLVGMEPEQVKDLVLISQKSLKLDV